jgi:chaperonin GroES
MSVKFKPLRNVALIKKIHPEKKTSSGIILTSQAEPDRGVVIEIGEGVYTMSGEFVPTKVKKGDVVLFGKNVGHTTIIDDETYIVLSENEILGVFEEVEEQEQR